MKAAVCAVPTMSPQREERVRDENKQEVRTWTNYQPGTDCVQLGALNTSPWRPLEIFIFTVIFKEGTYYEVKVHFKS